MSDSIYLKIYSIYLIRNLVTNKIYIGFTNKNPERRWKDHIYEMLHDSQCYIHRSMRKYGLENFTFTVIYQSLDGQDCLREKESYFIKKYNSLSPMGYNMTLGGEGILGYKRSDEQKKQQSIRMSGENHPGYGKPRPEETRKLISLKQKGRQKSVEHIKKLSKAGMGKTPWNKGIPQTEEARQKNQEAHIGKVVWNKGKSQSDDAKEKNRIAHLGKKQEHIQTKIICEQTNQIFKSVREASKQLNLCRMAIFKNLKGKRKHVGGFTFKRL